MSRTFVYLSFTILYFVTSAVVSQNVTETNAGGSPSSSVDTATDILSTTPEPPKNITCQSHNGNCKDCVRNSNCYYCDTDSRCHYRITEIISASECDLKKIHYWTCRTPFLYLMIGVGVVSGIALLVILIFCCYCCCKKKGVKISKSDLKWARQREERKQIAAEKRKERAERTEEIRRKYGLVKDSNAYQKFDNA